MPWVESKIQHPEVTGKAFQDASVALEDMTEPLSLIGDNLLASVSLNLATQGASTDDPWPELTPKYRRWKNAHGPGLPMLVGLHRAGGGAYAVSGMMRRELLMPAALHVTPRSLMYLPLSDIAGFHQEGTPRMRARPPVRITERQLLEWDAIAEEWLDSVLTGLELWASHTN